MQIVLHLLTHAAACLRDTDGKTAHAVPIVNDHYEKVELHARRTPQMRISLIRSGHKAVNSRFFQIEWQICIAWS